MQSPDVKDALANWNGELMNLRDVKVSVLDRAFLFGDSIYEVLRIYRGCPWRMEDHLDRLAQGLSALKIPFEMSTVRKRLIDTINKSAMREAIAYTQITRGAARRHHRYPERIEPNCLIYVEPFDDPFVQTRINGAYAITYLDIRWCRNDLKTTSLVANCMAAQAAYEKQAIEAILVNKNGIVTEASHSSVFAVKNNKVIVSPAAESVLPGITKKQVIELCRKTEIQVDERLLPADQINAVDELFITSTTEEIVPIVKVDDIQIGSGKVGEITRQLQTAFKQEVEQWLLTASCLP